MEKPVTTNNGKQIYGQKWEKNSQAISDSEINDDLPVPVESTGVEAATFGSGSNGESMYRASLEGDWVAAEVLVAIDPTLARDYITEKGDRALHVAAAMKHKEFVHKLIEHMNVDDLAMLDGRGYTPCCYAAISGVVEIARFMIDKSPNLMTARDENNVMPLHKAALRGNEKMVSYLLKSTKIEDLSAQEWFDLLLVAIRREMFDVAIEIVEKNGSLATMDNEEGTALHLLARQHISKVTSKWKSLLLESNYSDGYWHVIEPKSFNKLAKKLWDEMQTMEKASLLELMKKHHLLHYAAKAGHAKLITMVTRTYPLLIWEIDGDGYTIFHIATRYRWYDVLNLIPQIGVMIDLSATSQDQNGNNILHLAAKFAPRDRVRMPQSAFLMQRELALFKHLESMVPPSCLETRNKDGLTPRELFSKEHESLLEYSRTWMKNTADSFMLIATILLTVAFAAAFAVPGGYDGQTGTPILVESKKFLGFLRVEVFAVVGSVVSIMMFRCVIASSFTEDDFLWKLPRQLLVGFYALYTSLVTAVASFMSSISLGNTKIISTVWIGAGILILFCFFWVDLEIRQFCNSFAIPLSMNRSNKRNLFSLYPAPTNS